MRKFKLLALVALTSLTSVSYAQSNFEGGYARIGVGYSMVNLNASATATVPTSGNIVKSQSFDQINTLIGDIGVGYNWRIAPKVLLGIGAGILPSASSTASYSLTTITGTTVNGTSQLQNPWSVYITPGYELSTDQLLYAKLGYSGVTGVTSDPTFGVNKTTYNGYLLGLGFKTMIDKKVDAFIEYNYTNFSSQTSSAANVAPASNGAVPIGAMIGVSTSQPVASTILVGVSYHF